MQLHPQHVGNTNKVRTNTILIVVVIDVDVVVVVIIVVVVIVVIVMSCTYAHEGKRGDLMNHAVGNAIKVSIYVICMWSWY